MVKTNINIKEQYDNNMFLFDKHFLERGYKKINGVKISSKIDKSVCLVGSTISVLKKYITSRSIPNTGLFMSQRCIRTQNLKIINADSDKCSEWGSYFMALGGLVKYEQMERVIRDITEFLKQIVGSYKDIVIRINSNDSDMLSICVNNFKHICLEIDTMSEDYYKHKYGLDSLGIYGRNFNIAILDKRSNTYKDIGNIIVIETIDEYIGVEFSLGMSAIISRCNGFENTMKANLISDLYNMNNTDEYKLGDCLSVIGNLVYEDVFPGSSHMENKLLKNYIKGANKIAKKIGMQENEMIKLIEKYIEYEYGEAETIEGLRSVII